MTAQKRPTTHEWKPGTPRPNAYPGDTIWMRGGHWPSVHFDFQGLPGRPVLITNYPGEEVILDTWGTYAGKYYCNGWISGSYQTIVSHPRGGQILFTDAGPQTRGPDGQRPWALRVGTQGATERARSNWLANLRIQGTGGATLDTRAIDLEVYGCITTGWGWDDGGRRGHGHAWYAQNLSGDWKRIRNCFAGWGRGRGVQVFGNGDQVRDVLIEDSIFSSTSALAPPPQSVQPCISIGAESGGVADGCVVRRCEVNQEYPYPAEGGYGHQSITWVGPGKRIEIRDTYLSGLLNEVGEWADVIVVNDKQHYRFGSSQPDWSAKYPDNNTFVREVGPPEPSSSGNRVRVIPNELAPGRAHVAVWNWEDASDTQIPTAGWAQPFEFYKAENLDTGTTTIFGVVPGQTHIELPVPARFVAFLITRI